MSIGDAEGMVMNPVDFAKALGVAVALLFINVLIAILVVVAYRFLVEPGHPSEFYDEAALRIAPWCSHIAGTALFLGAGFLFTKWRPDRNAYLFATAFALLYAIIDASFVGFSVEIEFGLSLLAKLVAALVGVTVAKKVTQTPAPALENDSEDK